MPLTYSLELYLLEKKKQELTYLQVFTQREPKKGELKPIQLEDFVSAGAHFEDKPITDDAISDIYLESDRRTRKEESAEYMRTLTGKL